MNKFFRNTDFYALHIQTFKLFFYKKGVFDVNFLFYLKFFSFLSKEK